LVLMSFRSPPPPPNYFLFFVPFLFLFLLYFVFMLPASLEKMEAANSSKMLMLIYQTPRSHILQNSNVDMNLTPEICVSSLIQGVPFIMSLRSEALSCRKLHPSEQLPRPSTPQEVQCIIFNVV
jgi:hypothetical protein